MLLNYLTYNYDAYWERNRRHPIYTGHSAGDATTMAITSCYECIARKEYSMVWSDKYWTSPHDDGCAHARYKCTYIRIVHLDVSCIETSAPSSDIFSRIDATRYFDRRRHTDGVTLAPESMFAILCLRNARMENTAYVISRAIVYYSVR